MPGSDFQKFVANGNTLDRLSGHSNSEVQDVAAEVRGALFNAADNTAANPPDVLKDFQAAQLRYKASLTANDAIGKVGSSEAMTPLGLKQAIQRHYMDQLTGSAANTGPGYDMPDLARMIQAVPKLASSGTAERNMLYNAILGAGAGGASYLANPNALQAALYGAAPIAALSAAGRFSRLGAGAVPGGAAVAPYVNALNPLAPRVLGQGVGNLLATGNMPQPGGGQ
jgi:hypothetical protein